MTQWISLMDYAARKGVSLSTLRRYIKGGKIQYKVVNGRYLLPDSEGKASDDSNLAAELQRAKEEVAELKTLIAFYEDQLL